MGSHWEPTSPVLWRCHTGIDMGTLLTTREVCRHLGLSEPALRHVLRRLGAPRPAIHPSARVFLWTQRDIDDLAEFLGRTRPKPDHEEDSDAS